MQHLLELPPAVYAPGGPNAACRRSRAELLVVVLPAPAISQGLFLSHRGEQFGIEEFISEPAVEEFGKSVLHGEPGSIYVVVVVLLSAQRLRAWAMNSGPLSLRMNAGAG